MNFSISLTKTLKICVHLYHLAYKIIPYHPYSSQYKLATYSL